jgi:hypothetical protein
LSGGKAVRTTDAGRGLRVDFDAQGTPIGVEITSPAVPKRKAARRLPLPATAGDQRDRRRRRLRRRHVMGVCPMLSDETCWFLAADFDDIPGRRA